MACHGQSDGCTGGACRPPLAKQEYRAEGADLSIPAQVRAFGANPVPSAELRS